MLGLLGLSEYDESVYRHLLRGAATDVEGLAALLGCPTVRVLESFARLIDDGLIRPGAGGTLPASVDPEIAVRALVHRRQSELDAIVGSLADLEADYHAGVAAQRHPQAIETLVGFEPIMRRLMELSRSASVEVAGFDTPPYIIDDYTDELTWEAELLDRGVRMRTIYAAESLEIPEKLTVIRKLGELGEQARVLPTVPMKLTIFDRQVALVPRVSGDPRTTVVAVVHDSALIDVVVTLFETVWSVAPPLETTSRVTPDVDGELVAMLGAGIKDEAIARQLGVSVRTARRRIARLMEQLGASSRFQAGSEARRTGWL